ncbi:hypothetical protein [Carboxylicivirga marina]|uniref:hypothetical protein n=1 Tax=Carboxylicivirga marina TaxID=2800988 RepID=UPI002598AC3E|nr:hypothetical protein [uncultured Carboxylicivirga sp.]
MKTLLILVLTCLLSNVTKGQQKTIHVFVALCDNEFQGIVPVPDKLGNGKDPQTNLYWGAAYGVKSYFKNKSRGWKLVSTIKTNNPVIIERLLFKHVSKDVYMLADAYDGEEIQTCIEDFLLTSNNQLPIDITHGTEQLKFGGQSDLIAYIGHDGLMDFSVDVNYSNSKNKIKDVMILACYSKEYFSEELKRAKANPILWTTHLMAPEAYTLNSAIEGWLNNETGAEIDERAAQTYNKYQKCGIRGARNLFTTGF